MMGIISLNSENKRKLNKLVATVSAVIRVLQTSENQPGRKLLQLKHVIVGLPSLVRSS